MIKHCFYILAALSVSLPALAQNTAGLSATNSQRMRESISDYQREQQIKKFRRSYDEKKEQKNKRAANSRL